ncbi:hypothetical protein B0H14DRAFT_3859848 [Mycena olivaceomarginata]|nr:hypothetical protein B0H14DRAFT_3859848 [Mycena olivaceomarginata]
MSHTSPPPQPEWLEQIFEDAMVLDAAWDQSKRAWNHGQTSPVRQFRPATSWRPAAETKSLRADLGRRTSEAQRHDMQSRSDPSLFSENGFGRLETRGLSDLTESLNILGIARPDVAAAQATAHINSPSHTEASGSSVEDSGGHNLPAHGPATSDTENNSSAVVGGSMQESDNPVEEQSDVDIMWDAANHDTTRYGMPRSGYGSDLTIPAHVSATGLPARLPEGCSHTENDGFPLVVWPSFVQSIIPREFVDDARPYAGGAASDGSHDHLYIGII